VLLHGHGRTSVGAARWLRWERWIWELFKRTSSAFDAGSVPICFVNIREMVSPAIKDGRLFHPEQKGAAISGAIADR
jgi:hypothetical protein